MPLLSRASRFSVVAGCLLMAAGASRLQNLRLELEPWVGAGACQVAGTGDVVRSRGRTIEFTCGDPDRTIQCDFEGAEPLDTSVGQVCRTKRLPLQPGRSVTIEGVPANAVIEWLDTFWNKPPVVVASRPGALPQVTVNLMSTRALRVRRPDAAPVSLFPVADATGKPAAMALPNPFAGGELLIGLEAAVVRPISVSISQQAVAIANVATSGDRLAAATLPAGEYLIAPIYAGNVAGDPLRVRVETGDSTFVSLPRADVGALALKVSDDLCVEAPQAVVSSVERLANGSTSREIAAISLTEQGCQVVVAGLRPGAYAVELTSPSTGLKVKEPLAITSQAVTAVSLSAPTVRLFGRVTISKRPPASGTRVMLQPANVSDPAQETRVALRFDGTFEARVRVPGPYLVRLVSVPVAGIGTTREVSLKEGYNELNWDVEGGTLKLGIKNWDRSSFVEVTLRRVKSPGSGPTSQQSFSASEVTSGIDVQDELPVTIEALDFSDYVIEARQLIRSGIPRVSTPVTVSLTSARPTAEVELELFSYESVIRLVDGSGQPVTSAQARTVEGLIREIEPGVFSITGQHGNPGTEVQLRAPGYVSACKAAPQNGISATVILRVGQPAVLRYLGRDDFSRPVGQILPPGSDCWVPLSEFVYSLAKVSPTQVDATIQNWPGGSVPYRISPSFPSLLLSIGPDGFAVIQLPGR